MSNVAPNTQLENHDSSSILKLIHSVPDLLSEAYESQLSAIQTLAESLENYQEHETFETAATQLIEYKPSVLHHVSRQFVKHLNESRKVSGLQEEQALNFHTDNLSIVTDSEIDHQLMLEKGFTNSNHNFAGLLVETGWKFCNAVKKSSANAQLECVRPGFLALLIQETIDHYIENKEVARIAYRFVGAKFFALLADFYHNISPELSEIVEKHKVEEKQLDEVNQSDLPLAEVSDGTGVTADDIKAINKALGTNIDVTGLLKNWDVPAQLGQTSEGDFDGFTELDLADMSPDTQIRTATIEDVTQLLKALTNESLVDSDAILDTNDVRSALKESLSNLSDEGILTVIDRVSENVLNLVSHLFDSLSESGGFITDVQNQLARLQPPVMQVALADTKLFQSNEHPVREYLNQVSNLGVRISDPNEEGFIELRDSINDVLKEFSGDVEIFAKHADSLNQYIDNSVYAIKHADGNFEAQEFAKAMKHTAISDFLDSQNHLLEQELTFHKLIKYVWGAILARVIRRHGTESQEWNQGTELYSSILWSTQVDATDEGKREILRTLPKIVPSIRNVFLDYNLKTELRDAILEHMIQLHLAIIRGTDGKCIKDPSGSSLDVFKCFQGKIMEDSPDQHQTELEAVDVKGSDFSEDRLSNVYERFDQISPFEDIPTLTEREDVDWGEISEEDNAMIREIRTTKKEDHSNEDLQAVFAKLNQLPLESIFTLIHNDEESRCKLTKKSVALGTFTFTTFDTEETFEMKKGELALEIIRGQAKQVDEYNLFDNALERVVMQIQANNQ